MGIITRQYEALGAIAEADLLQQEEEKQRIAEEQKLQDERTRKNQQRCEEEKRRTERRRQLQQEIDRLTNSLWRPSALLIGLSIWFSISFFGIFFISHINLLHYSWGLLLLAIPVLIVVYWIIGFKKRASNIQKIAMLKNQLQHLKLEK
jgi:Flp pilus assembly protein TadB